MRQVFNGKKRSERIDGTGEADDIYGNGGNDKLVGHPGDDLIVGGKGHDTIFGGQNHDTLWGDLIPKPELDRKAAQDWSDRFCFNAIDETTSDTVMDFKHKVDTIGLDVLIFDELEVTNKLSAEHLVQGTAALEADDFLLYDRGNGELWYDQDGSGEGSAVLLATFDNHEKITASDIFVFMPKSEIE